MKNFLKMILAVVIGILIAGIITTFITIGIIGAAGSTGKKPGTMPKDAVLRIDLSETVIAEQTQEANPLESLRKDSDVRVIGIWDAVQAINAAASDPNVKFIYLKTDGNTNDIAHLQEFRAALSAFRTSGKPVISYMETATTGDYYLASVSDKVFMTSHPGATTMMTGIGIQMVFLKDLLDKLGVNYQLIRHGKYKSAGERWVRNSPSPENLEQYQVMIASMWTSLASEIAASREISVEDFNRCIDDLTLVGPEDFVKEKLVDELLTREELKVRLTTFAVADRFDDINMVSLGDYVDIRNAVPAKAAKGIAVIYADGNIVDGSDVKGVAGDRFASVIAKVRADSTVKAVVLRVNSPGGTVLASEKIKTELDLLKKEKPLIASYGSYAASGGYWISNNCDRIFSDATTLTGSIGVFGLIPDFSRTARDIAHVNITTVTSNKHGDMFTFMRPLDSAEKAFMLSSIEDIYDRFTTIVSEGRGLEKSYVDEIGQGRVWTGSDAREKGLVDEIGTLEDAVRYAAICAGDGEIGNWKVTGYPKPLTSIEIVMEMLGQKKDNEENIFAGTALESVSRTMLNWVEAAKESHSDVVFARLPFQITIR